MLTNANDIKMDTCQSEYNMKKTLIKVKTRKIPNRKHESNVYKTKGA